MNKILFKINIIFIVVIIMTITSFIYIYQNNTYNINNNNNINKNKGGIEVTQTNTIRGISPINLLFLDSTYAERPFVKESHFIIPSFASPSNTTSDINQRQNHFNIEIPFGAGKPANLFEYYTPSSIHIKKGDSITWVNNDAVSHTVTAAQLNSGLIWPQGSKFGISNFTYTFDNSGIISYFCQIHPYMSGTVYVNVTETQRELVSTIGDKVNVFVEMPIDTAYENYYDHYFIPANTFVPVGGTITWVNNDYVPHTATAADNSFDTKIIDPFGSKSLEFTNEGRIAYYCKIHPWMQASITVTSN